MRSFFACCLLTAASLPIAGAQDSSGKAKDEVTYEGQPAGYWVKMLKDRAASFRIKAANALSEIGADDEKVVPGLIACLHDKEETVRVAAALALGRIEPTDNEKIVPALVAAMKDQNRDVRDAASRALGCVAVGAKTAWAIEKCGGTILDERKNGKRWEKITLNDHFFSEFIEARMAYLRGLMSLDELYIGVVCEISDEALANLKGLTNLQSLTLDGAQVSATGLGHLRSLVKLDKLTLYRNDIGDAHLAQLKHFTGLTYLTLGKISANDAALANLGGLTNLRNLSLYGSFSDAGVAHLKGLTNLRDLELAGSITDASLTHLKGMTNLTTLRSGWLVEGSFYTKHGLDELKKTLLNLR